MPESDLHILPKLRDSMSYLYVEHCAVDGYHLGVEIVDQNGAVHVPIASLAVLLLGPGTRITHTAVKRLAENGCSLVWVGEDGLRCYAQGSGETRSARRLLYQAQSVCDPVRHKQVVLRMYAHRFDEMLDPKLTIEQIRGREGVRVRNVYATMSRRYGVTWDGRRYERGQWGGSDPVNRALSAANALLNGICHAAIVSGGYSTALGFIHTGKQLSFVYDIADLYKTELTIPAAFRVASEGSEKIETRVRALCRERFRETRLLERILPDIDAVIGSNLDLEQVSFDDDGALPGALWDDVTETDE